MIAHKLLVISPELNNRAAKQPTGLSLSARISFSGKKGRKNRAYQKILFNVFGFSIAARALLIALKIAGKLLPHEHILFNHQHAGLCQPALFFPAFVIPLNMEGNFHQRKTGIGVFHARFLFHCVHDLPQCAQNLFLGTFKKSDRTQMRWMGVKGAFDIVNSRAINAVFARIER